MADMSVVCLRV